MKFKDMTDFSKCLLERVCVFDASIIVAKSPSVFFKPLKALPPFLKEGDKREINFMFLLSFNVD